MQFLSIRLILDEICVQMKYKNIEILPKILSPQDRIIWESMGLTSDIQSMENAALLTKAIHFSFVFGVIYESES